MLIGYARVSTQQQTTDPQEDELRRAGCEKIFRDVTSGAKADRPGLASMLTQARRSDVIVVVRLDRLGRSLIHLVSTVEKLERDKIGFRSLAEKIDSTSAGGKLILHIFASLAQFERSLITERVRAGLDSARARGRVGGRPRKDDRTRQAMAALMLDERKNSVQDVCRALKVSRATAFRLVKAGRATRLQQPPAATTPAGVSAAAPRMPIHTGKPTNKARTRGKRGVPPPPAPQSGKAAISSLRKPAGTAKKAETPTTAKSPRKGTKTTGKKRSP